ncbi:MAG: PAS domain S-box protein [Nitrosarchaeum sp.]|nr:PAS domain S-box protein [Nitrosarchaeum sp.]
MPSIKDDTAIKILFEASPDMLAILDKNGKIVDCNAQCAKNLGYEKSEMIGMIGPIDMVLERDRHIAVDGFEKVVTNGINHNVSFEMKRKNNTTFSTLWSGAVLHDESGNIEGYLVTGKDLTAIKNLENELIVSRDRIKINRFSILGELSAKLTHDIKNPLSSIFNRVDLIKMTTKEEKTLEHCDKIKYSLDQILRQINDVTDFVRIPPIKLQKNSLQELLKNTLEYVDIPNKISIELPKDDHEINCDESQLIIVFTNLISNAVQKLGDDGKISIQYDSTSTSHLISVIDSGESIPDYVMPRIFEPLFTTKQKGTGLGLASCKSVMVNHGGSISVKNNPVTFTIILPKNQLA